MNWHSTKWLQSSLTPFILNTVPRIWQTVRFARTTIIKWNVPSVSRPLYYSVVVIWPLKHTPKAYTVLNNYSYYYEKPESSNVWVLKIFTPLMQYTCSNSLSPPVLQQMPLYSGTGKNLKVGGHISGAENFFTVPPSFLMCPPKWRGTVQCSESPAFHRPPSTWIQSL